jgi:hypothetical protein
MRFLIAIFLVSGIFASCVKKTSKDPVPQIEFLSAGDMYLTKSGNDTAIFVIHYEDGDGDLFVDNNDQGQNLFITTYYFSRDSNKFLIDNNGKPFGNTIKQPDNGYYKGKPITGEITIPTKEFRSGPSRKIIKFAVQMIDLKKHESNISISPVYTLNF